jgi:N-acetylneuraminic acid mutarotase
MFCSNIDQEDAMKRKTLIYLPILILLGLGVLLLGAWDMQQAAAAPEPEAWLQAESAPNPVLFYGFAQCADEPDLFYVLGSYPGQTYFYRYDASNDVWAVLPAFPIPIERSALVCYQDKIYAAGGNSGSDAIDTLYIYDIAEEYWTQGPDMPHVLKQAAVGVWDSKIYLAGGTMTSSPWPPIDHVDIFDIASSI